MKRVASKPVSPGDDLDELLRAYFQAEMPRPWPRFQSPTKARLLPLRPQSPPTLPQWTSRVALVAAAVLLLLGLALLPRPNATSGERPDVLPTIGPPSATKEGLPRGPVVQPPVKVKSSLHFEQGDDGRTGIKITVEELTPDR